mgnify:CR=1 FL=1
MDAIVKNLNFGDGARDNVFKGIKKLTKAVSSTLGAGGKCVMLEDHLGNPIITKDGVTVADSVILRDPVENMGATLLKEAARKTNKILRKRYRSGRRRYDRSNCYCIYKQRAKAR